MKLRTLTLTLLAAGSLTVAGTSVAQTAGTKASSGAGGAAQSGSVQSGPAQGSVTASSGSVHDGVTALDGSVQDSDLMQIDSGDQTFMENAAQGGFAEVEAGQMALHKAQSADVKAFAQKMIEDHSKVNDELAALAKKKGYNPPTEPSLMQKAELKTLSLTDDGFDEMYARRMGVAAHEDTVEMFREASTNAKDPDLRAFAAKHLPTLEKHLEMARSLKQKVDSKNP